MQRRERQYDVLQNRISQSGGMQTLYEMNAEIRAWMSVLASCRTVLRRIGGFFSGRESVRRLEGRVK